eukprot:403367167
MFAQSLIHSCNFSFDERRYWMQQNSSELFIDQANHCATTCITNVNDSNQYSEQSRRLIQRQNQAPQHQQQIDQQSQQTVDQQQQQQQEQQVEILSGREQECVSNCIEKMFISEKLLKTYLPQKFAKITQKDIEHRLNNPTDSYGKYFST